jgi:GTP-binding protein
VVADPHLHTLLDYTYRRVFRAGRGAHGGSAHKTGARGEDVIIPVPVGSEVYDADTGELLADLRRPGQRLLAARGGRGGRGNAAFATPQRQAPRFAELGLPGEKRRLRIVLKLLADVGLLGLPNVGKSSLLRRVSTARPRVAAYPFTTLQPQLGVVRVGEESFVLADLPGLIQGAHAGAGLGHQFLRHLERTRLLVHVLDAAAFDRDLLADFAAVNEELRLYSPRLASLPQIVAINKLDVPGTLGRARQAADQLEAQGWEVHLVSALTGAGVARLMGRCLEVLKSLPVPAAEEAPLQYEAPRPRQEPLRVERDAEGVFVVHGTRPALEVAKTDLRSPQALEWLHERLQRLGVMEALRAAGAQAGDRVRIGNHEFEYLP